MPSKILKEHLPHSLRLDCCVDTSDEHRTGPPGIPGQFIDNPVSDLISLKTSLFFYFISDDL